MAVDLSLFQLQQPDVMTLTEYKDYFDGLSDEEKKNTRGHLFTTHENRQGRLHINVIRVKVIKHNGAVPYPFIKRPAKAPYPFIKLLGK